ncbi:MAG TPA: dephospho-CoA kinase [Candidatus Sulfotelmatobacter sp.]|nr:dephospho-CoA kinase [Candidatus Sulfotelmatobacter sp.]
MRKIGLTGGIASGKSTVAAMLHELGFDVIFADKISRRLLDPGQAAYDETIREFGREIVLPDGTLDRKTIASIVFADRAKLDRLNAIIHPRVEVQILKQFADWEREGKRTVTFVEAALLVEAGYMKNLDGLIVTWCKPEQQLERLIARGMTEQEARSRIGAQMSVEEKLKLATYKIDCSQTIEETRCQVQELAKTLRA